MEAVLIYTEPQKMDFLINLLKEFSFVKVIENYTVADEAQYVDAILESEAEIEAGNVISHENLKNEIRSWRIR